MLLCPLVELLLCSLPFNDNRKLWLKMEHRKLCGLKGREPWPVVFKHSNDATKTFSITYVVSYSPHLTCLDLKTEIQRSESCIILNHLI